MTKSILITGCSSGIGYRTATILKERGYRVFATARKIEDVERLRLEGFDSIELDVNDSASIQGAIRQVTSLTGGTLDALFNNAGFLQPGSVEDVTRDMDRAQFETNVFGAMEVIRQVLPIMRQQGHGRIIQNSSILGIIAMTMCGSYNASKFAVEGYLNTLRQELRGTGIYVSLINPGPIKSELRENSFTQFKKHLQNKPSLYQATYDKMEASYFNPGKTDRALQQEPSAVANKVIRALESRYPLAHYYVGFPAYLFAVLRRILPDCMLDWILARVR